MGENLRVALTQGAVVTAVGAAVMFVTSLPSTPATRMAALVQGVLIVAILAFPFVSFGVYAARRWIGLAPLPFIGRAMGVDPLPPRLLALPGFAVAGAIVMIVGSIPLSFLLPRDVIVTGDHPLVGLSGPGILLMFLSVLNEEIVFRLILLFPLAALLRARVERPGEPPGLRAWIAILVSGVLFGLAHFGTAEFLIGATMEQWLVYSVVQKGLLAGGVFGYIAWRWGLETAFVSHYAADVMLVALYGLA